MSVLLAHKPEAAPCKNPSGLLALGWKFPLSHRPPACPSRERAPGFMRGGCKWQQGKDSVSSPGCVASAVGKEKARRSAEECQAIGTAGAGAISAGQEQVCLLSPKPGIRGAEFLLLAKRRAVFCAKMRRDFSECCCSLVFSLLDPYIRFLSKETKRWVFHF